MRIHFVNRFYWPAEPATAQLLHDLAESLSARGHQVTLLTSRGNAAAPKRENHHGVEIVRVGAPHGTSSHLAQRALAFLRFNLATLHALPRLVRRHDVVVALTDPPLIGVSVAGVARARGAHVFHWIHDIYPEVFEAVTPHAGARFAAASLRPLRNAAWRRSAACITLGEAMAAVVQEAGVAESYVHVVPNWAPHGLAPADPAAIQALRQRWQLGDQFVVGYSGNLGRVHDLHGLLKAAETLQSMPGVVFLFIGHGAGFAALQSAATSRQLTNVRFVPPQPRAALAATLGVPDLHIVSLREGCERYVFPSKLYGIAAVGRPTLALAAPNADVSRIVIQHRLGATHRSGDTASIASSLRTIANSPEWRRDCGAAALRFHHQAGGLNRATDRWASLLARVQGSP